MDLDTNLLRVAILPINFFTLFIFLGGLMSGIVLIFSGLASIPLSKTMKPINLSYAKDTIGRVKFNLVFLEGYKSFP